MAYYFKTWILFPVQASFHTEVNMEQIGQPFPKQNTVGSARLLKHRSAFRTVLPTLVTWGTARSREIHARFLKGCGNLPPHPLLSFAGPWLLSSVVLPCMAWRRQRTTSAVYYCYERRKPHACQAHADPYVSIREIRGSLGTIFCCNLV